jgi:DNA-binding MarR family transcriptional regulator
MKQPGGHAAELENSHPRHQLDEIIHAPVRFSIIALLVAAEKAEFGYVRDSIEVSDSVLSKQINTLEKAGYVNVIKGYVGKRPRTWLSLTAEGRKVFVKHCAALRAISEGTGSASGDVAG